MPNAGGRVVPAVIAMRYRVLLMLGLSAAAAAASAAYYRDTLFGGIPSSPETALPPLVKSIVKIEDQPDFSAFLEAISGVQRQIAARAWTRPAAGAAGRSDAAGGDERLPMAFELLRQNKPEAATRLLQAVGEDRLARSKQERADAVVAYRALGAIAATQQQALDAYAKAIALDANDVESLIGGGWIALQQGVPGEAERRLRRALPLLAGDAEPWNRFRINQIGRAHV